MLSLHPNKGSRLSKKLDTWFWWILRLAPLLLMLLMEYSGVRTGSEPGSGLNYYISTYFGFIDFNNPILITLDSLFMGESAVLPFFDGSIEVNYYFAYLVYIEIVHVFFDVIVFIPRLAHKWISNAVQDD